MFIAEDPKFIDARHAIRSKAVGNQPPVIVIRINLPGNSQLAHVAHALRPISFGFCPGKSRQQQGREDGNNRDDHQQLNQSKSGIRTPSGEEMWVRLLRS